MSKKKLLVAAGVLAAIGAAAAIAQGHREGRHGSDHMGRHGMDRGMGMGDVADMRGRRWGSGGALTAEEHAARTRERFARLDKNGDGVLDLAEIEAGLSGGEGMLGRMRERRGAGAGDHGDRLLRRFDTNKDGKVTKEEFLAEVRRIFAEFDLNNDSKIDDADLPPIMRGRNALAGGDGAGHRGGRGMHGQAGGAMNFIRGADANKDGVVTLDEALAHATRQFDTFDRTKDGAVDKADFDALRKEMTDYRVQRFVHQFGADKEGKVTKDQFYAKAKERFARMDFDNDGRITRQDSGQRGGMRDRMREWMGRGGPDRPRDGTPQAPKNAPVPPKN